MLDFGLRTALAIKLFKDNTVTLEKAAKLADVTIETFIERLGKLGVPAVNYSPSELEQELKNFG